MRWDSGGGSGPAGAAPLVAEEGGEVVGEGRRGPAESMVVPTAVECGAGRRSCGSDGKRRGDGSALSGEMREREGDPGGGFIG